VKHIEAERELKSWDVELPEVPMKPTPELRPLEISETSKDECLIIIIMIIIKIRFVT